MGESKINNKNKSEGLKTKLSGQNVELGSPAPTWKARPAMHTCNPRHRRALKLMEQTASQVSSRLVKKTISKTTVENNRGNMLHQLPVSTLTSVWGEHIDTNMYINYMYTLKHTQTHMRMLVILRVMKVNVQQKRLKVKEKWNTLSASKCVYLFDCPKQYTGSSAEVSHCQKPFLSN